MIKIFEPAVGPEEEEAVAEVLRSGWLGRGEKTLKFEKGLAQILDVPLSRLGTMSNCTEGLFAMPKLLERREGEIIVPSISFPAVGSAILENGYTPVIVDVDDDGNIDIDQAVDAVGRDTCAVLVTHYGGTPIDIPVLRAALKRSDIKIFEDAACALGSSLNGRACGTEGDMATWSFDAMKLVTTGEGGAFCCNSDEQAAWIRRYFYLGLPANAKSGLDRARDAGGWWEYDLNFPGRRSLLGDIAAAIGVQQLAKMEGFLARRREIADIYRRELASLNWLTLPREARENEVHSNYFFTIKSSMRDRIALHLKASGVYSTFRYWPLHNISVFSGYARRVGRAHELASTGLNIPIHQNLTDANVEQIVEALKSFEP